MKRKPKGKQPVPTLHNHNTQSVTHNNLTLSQDRRRFANVSSRIQLTVPAAREPIYLPQPGYGLEEFYDDEHIASNPDSPDDMGLKVKAKRSENSVSYFASIFCILLYLIFFFAFSSSLCRMRH